MTEIKTSRSIFSTPNLLIGALTVNAIAIGLSEVQRRGLTIRTDRILAENLQRQTRTIDEYAKRINTLNAEIRELRRTATDAQQVIGSLQTIVGIGLNLDRHELETRVIKRLTDGKQIVVQFDQNPSEAHDSKGNILCGPDAESGYLGVFIAGQRYAINYDAAARTWTGAGPSQNANYNSKTRMCGTNTLTYGLEKLGADVSPNKDDLVLWGERLKLDGLNVLRSGHKVGSVIWLD